MAYTRLPMAVWLPTLVSLLLVGHCEAWDYSDNGASWASIGQCGSGGPQSPINLPAFAEVVEADEQKLFLKYPKLDEAFPIYHNGKSIALTLPQLYKGGFGLGKDIKDFLSEDADAYRLWQVNFHTPSEHTLKGERMPLEMQMMHKRVTGGKEETAVVVVLFQSAANTYVDFLDALTLGGVPSKPWEEKMISKPVEFSEVVGGSPFYTYEGSITVPPCERAVKYYVRQEPIPAAMTQLRRFAKVLKETCAPGGNYRVAQHFSGVLQLLASVNVEKDPEATVKPKPSKIEAGQAELADGAGSAATEFHCPSAWIDIEFKNIGRIKVGESEDLIAAKTRYNREKRELQVADGAATGAYRSYTFAKSLYDNSPGLAEKINNKWGLVNAKSVFDGALKNLETLGAKAGEEDTLIKEALERECYKIYGKEQEKKKEYEKKHPPPPITPPKYAEPHVTLPQGIDASPFSAVAEGEGKEGAGLPAKIASNLHQEEVPEAAAITEAKGKKETAEEAEPNPEKILQMSLPIDPTKVGDKATFKSDLLHALAFSADIAPSRLEVKEVHPVAVASVHASMSLAQVNLRGSH